MNLNYLKELPPVLYGSGVVKILKRSEIRPNNLCFAAHWHERMELLRVYSGVLVAEIGQKKYEIRENQTAIIPPCCVHSGITDNNGVVYNTVMFDIAPLCNNTHVSKELLEPIFKLEVDFAKVTSNPDIISCLDTIIESKKKQDNASALLITAEIYKLLGLLYRHCLKESTSAHIYDGRLENIIDYINKNFLEDITSASLSKKFGYSQSYFSRRFKQVTGISPAVYIRILRLEEAKRRLASSTESISNIAQYCRFNDLYYFSVCFKNNYGMTPSEFIKSERHI